MKEYLNRIITVKRKDQSIRDVMIMKDELSNKYCFVNLTTYHVCKCRFDNVEDALCDLMQNENVVSFTINEK